MLGAVDRGAGRPLDVGTVPSIGRRIASDLYEGLLLLALLLIASFPIAGLKGATLGGVGQLLFQAYLLLVTASYFCWQWCHRGQTLPMKTWGFRVVDTNGRALTWARAFVRFLFASLFYGPVVAGLLLLFFPQRMAPVVAMWFFLPLTANLLYARFDREGQFLSDRLAGTRLQQA